MARHGGATPWALAALLASSCVLPATEVRVALATDAPSDTPLTVRVEVRPGSAVDGPLADGGAHAWVFGGPGGARLPADFTVAPGEGSPHDATVTLVLEAQLAASGGRAAESFRRVVRFAFTPGAATRVPIFLAVRCGEAASGCTDAPATGCTVSALCEQMNQTCGDDGMCVASEVSTLPAGAGADGGGGGGFVLPDGAVVPYADASPPPPVPCVPGSPGCPCASCASGELCSGGRCAACGGAGQACCPGGGCGDGYACDTGSRCEPCGLVGMICCTGGTCGPWSYCNAGTCDVCGQATQHCCPGHRCAGGTICNDSGRCHNCGYNGDPCCPRGYCPGGSVRCYKSCAGVGDGGTCHDQCDHTSCCLP